MKSRTGAVVLLLATLVAAAAHGQEPRRIEPLRVQGFAGPRFGGAGVEHIMSLRDELKLTDDQLRQLEELRKQRVQREQEMIELRSRAAAGALDREALRSQMDEQRDQLRKAAESTRDQVEKILTQEQRDRVRERTRVLRSGVLAPTFGRGLRVAPRLRSEFRPGGGPLNRVVPRLRGFEPGTGNLNRVMPRLRELNELSVTPHYYWFGSGPDRGPRMLRRRGML